MVNKKQSRSRRNKKNRQQQPASGSGHVNPQNDSLLMTKLPQEVRDEIYRLVFSSTRLTSGERMIGRINSKKFGTAPHALALLRVCRLTHSQIGSSWLQQVLFNFESPEAMLNKLAPLSTATLSLIRHIRVSGDPLMISYPQIDDDIYHRTHEALELLPGLKLDVLTVLATRSPEIIYDTLNSLVKQGDGWKELRYLSYESAFLGYATASSSFPVLAGYDTSPDPYMRLPQPLGWKTDLKLRDGPRSSPSVTIYRAKSPGCDGSIFHHDSRVQFEQKLGAGQSLVTFGATQVAGLTTLGEIKKEVLVVVKRGRGIDYSQRSGKYNSSGTEREMYGTTWQQLKNQERAYLRDGCSDSDFSEDGSAGEKYEVDRYSDVDDYEWPPLHFSNAI